MENGNCCGFVTIATGCDRYYQLAATLLHSYRKQKNSHFPFAILCDRENEYTKEFDCVVVMEKAVGSYLDKLKLYQYSPFEKTIFIDADALFLNDTKHLWDDFAACCGVCCYGETLDPNSEVGWFQKKNAGKYKDDIQFSLSLHGGIYYFDKSELARSVFELAIGLSEEYGLYQFRNFVRPADEPVIAMSMAVHGLHPCEKRGRILFLPSLEGKLWVNTSGQLFLKKQKVAPIVIHFATKNTTRFLYRILTEEIEVEYGCGGHNLHDHRKHYLHLLLTCLPMEIKSTGWFYLKRAAKRLLPNSVIYKIKKILK